MKQIWAERLRSKRLKEKFTSLWSESIAEAARRGGSGEVELDWDSYEKAKLEILSEEKARTKEQNRVRAEEAKTEKKVRRVVERQKERQERDQRGGKTRKPQQSKESATTASRSKLKKRLTKVKIENIPWNLRQKKKLTSWFFCFACLVRFIRRKQVLVKLLLEKIRWFQLQPSWRNWTWS